MHKDLLDALEIIGAITSVGKLKIETKLRNLSPQEQLQILAMIKSADRLAYFWQDGWVQAARAWMLARVSRWISVMGFDPPNDEQTQINGWVNQLRIMAESTVRQQLSALVTARGTLEALVRAQSNSERQAWQPSVAFTDPKYHNPAKFCYFIHAMRPTAGLGVPSKDTLAMHEYSMKHLGPFITTGSDRSLTLKSAKLYLTNPSVIEAEMLSCSLISQDHKKLYGNFSFGFILNVPCENVCIASSSDLALSNSKARAAVLALQPTPLHRLVQVDDFLDSLLGLYLQPLTAPGLILAQSNPKSHNEVVALGFSGSKRVRVTGIFIKVTSKNMMWQSFVADDTLHHLRDLILSCADTCQVPIVPIQDDNEKCPGSDITFKDWLKGHKPAKKPVTSKSSMEREPGWDGTSSLRVGDMVSVYRDQNVIREYDMIVIRQDAGQLLQQGLTPEEVHRRMHDRGGLPHAVVERALELLGHRNYM